jgi:hypothetical protein
MPANTNPLFIGDRKNWPLTFDETDTTTLLDLVVAGANGSLIESIVACTTDTSAVELDIYLDDGAVTYPLGSVTITAGAGTDGGTTPAVNILNQTDLPWLRDDLTLPLEAGMTLQVAAHATITAAKDVWVVAIGGDY